MSREIMGIIDETELEVLNELGIELENGKLINTKTGNTFYPVKGDKVKYGSHYYKCDDFLIEFIYIKEKPASARIFNNGMEYFVWGKETGERGLCINRIGSKLNIQVNLHGNYNKRFLDTTIYCENELYPEMPSSIRISGSFTNLYVNDVNYSSLNIDDYRNALEVQIESIIDDKAVSREYLRFMDFFSNGFEKLLSFPVHFKDEFLKEFKNDEYLVNTEFANAVSDLTDYEDQYVRELDQDLVKSSAAYITKILDYKKYVDGLLNGRKQKLDSINQDRQLLFAYIMRYNRFSKKHK